MEPDKTVIDLYPTGFITSDWMTAKRLDRIRKYDMTHPHPREDVDADVVRLMSAYRTRDPSIRTPAFALKVLETAMNKFGDDPVRWFLLQYESNDFVYDTNLSFLDDTVKFIVSGQRDISVRTWSDLVIRNPSRRPGESSVSRGSEARKLLLSLFPGNRGRNNLYRKWIGRNEEGVTDMLWTLFILFGQTGQPMGSK